MYVFLLPGGDEPMAEARRQLLEVRMVSRGSLKTYLVRYVPEVGRNMVVLVPINISPWH